MIYSITNITVLLGTLLFCFLITTSRHGASAPAGLQQQHQEHQFLAQPGQSWFWSPGVGFNSRQSAFMPASSDQIGLAARLRRQTEAAILNKKKKSSPMAKSSSQKRVVAECLAAHNKWRRLHGVPELQWDNKLAAFAQKRSDHIAKSDGAEFGHPADLIFGENLFWHSSLDKGCEFMVRGWYDEIQLYDFKAPSFAPATGHFTQLVWRGTTRVGCAFTQSTGPRGGLYLTCNYDPPGNFVGEFEDNVTRPGRAVAAQPAPSTPTPITSTSSTTTSTTGKPEIASVAPAADDAALSKAKKNKSSKKNKNKDKKKKKKNEVDEKDPKNKKNKSKRKRKGKKKNVSTSTTTTTSAPIITTSGPIAP